MSDLRPAESASIVAQYLPSPIASASVASSKRKDSFSPEGYHEASGFGYRDHKMGREIGASALGAPLSMASAVAEYRFNFAVRETNPFDHRYVGLGGKFYDINHWLGKIFQIFMPRGLRGKRLTEADIRWLHQSGIKYKAGLNVAYLLPMLARLGTNVFSDLDGATPWERAAVRLDSLSLLGRGTSLGMYGWGHILLALRWVSSQSSLSRLFMRSHQFAIGGNVFQMGAGLLRLSLEYSKYIETGQIDGATMLCGVADTFWGATGVGWYYYVLREGQLAASSTAMVNGVSAQNHALMECVNFSKRINWGMKAAGGFASGIGFGMSLYHFIHAANDFTLSGEERSHAMVSNGLGMASSLLMGASALMVGTALAPVGCILMAGALSVMIGQAAYDYFA